MKHVTTRQPGRRAVVADEASMTKRGRWLSYACAVVLVVAATGVVLGQTGAPERRVSPVFEGWESNADGTYTMFFGYFNTDWDDSTDVEIGPNNSFQPVGLDRGQPTHFLPRRNWWVFTIDVPKDWGTKELVWSVTAHGQTERAYGTLLASEEINDQVISMNTSGSGYIPNNKPPTIQLEGPTELTIRLGEEATLTALVTDDGQPKPRAAPGAMPNGQNQPPGRMSSVGLRVAWMHYRGPGQVTFNPEPFKVYRDPRGGSPWAAGWTPPPLPPDGKTVTHARFSEPGKYLLRLLAHDGYLSSAQNITVTVTPTSSPSAPMSVK